MAKKKHGGRRPGAGRRTDDPTGPKRRVTFYATPSEVSHLESIGNGNIPDGLRRLLAESIQREVHHMTENDKLLEAVSKRLYKLHKEGQCQPEACQWCNECPGHERGGKKEPCCERAGEFDGGAGGEYPRDFHCPKHCSCHD